MEPTVAISSIQRWIALAELDGLDPMEVLATAGIGPDVLHADYGLGRTTVSQFRTVIEIMLDQTGDELLGRSTHPVRRGTCALLLSALISSADLREVLGRAVRHIGVFPGLPPLTVSTDNRTVRVTVDTSQLDDPNHLLNDLALALLHRSASWFIGQRVALTALEMPYPAPPRTLEFEAMFGRAPTFGHDRAAFAFDAALLDAPVVRTERDLKAMLAGPRTEFISMVSFSSTTSEQVRSIVETGLSGSWPSAEDIAAKLAISAQHLRRKLHDEQTSVTQIREEILRDAAIASLTQGLESVAALSSRLGFSEVSAFRRAFRRWTGSPPGAYRQAGDSED